MAEAPVSPRSSPANEVRRRVLTNWCNFHLQKVLPPLDCLPLVPKLFTTYFEMGNCAVLFNIIEVLSQRIMSRLHNVDPKTPAEKLANVEHCLAHITEKLYAPHLSAQLIARGNEAAITDLLFLLAQAYQMDYPKLSSEDARVELMKWMNQRLPANTISNFLDDLRSGVVLCELVNSFKAGAIPSKKIGKDPKKNCALALAAAEKELQIPPILNAEDFTKKPDDLANLLYLAFFKSKDKTSDFDILKQIKEAKKNAPAPIVSQVSFDKFSTPAIQMDKVPKPEEVAAADKAAGRSKTAREARSKSSKPADEGKTAARDDIGLSKQSGSAGSLQRKGREHRRTVAIDTTDLKKAQSVRAPKAKPMHDLKPPPSQTATPIVSQPIDSKSPAVQINFQDLQVLARNGLLKQEDLANIWLYLNAPNRGAFVFGAQTPQKNLSQRPAVSLSAPVSPISSPLSPRSQLSAEAESQQITLHHPTEQQIAGFRPHQICQLMVSIHSGFQPSFFVVKGTSKPGGNLVFNIFESSPGVACIQFIPLFSGNHVIAVTYKAKQVSGSPCGFVVPEIPGVTQAAPNEPAQATKLLVHPQNARANMPISLQTSPVFDHSFLPVHFTREHVTVSIVGPVKTQGFVSQVASDSSVQFAFTPTVQGEYNLMVSVLGRPIFPGPVNVVVAAALNAPKPAATEVSPEAELDALLAQVGLS